MWKRCGIVGALVVVLATSASAQTVTNPRTAEWQHSAVDYAATQRYEFGWFLSPTAAQPYATADLGKPANCPDSGAGMLTCRVNLPARPAFGNFIAKLRAYGKNADGTDAVSPWSDPSNPFDIVLGAPSAAKIQ